MIRSILTTIGFIYAIQTTAATRFTLDEALRKGIVNANIRGVKTDSVTESSHYGACIKMELNNLTNIAYELSLDFGFQLAPNDEKVQTMMVTKTMVVMLEPHKKKSCKVYAMCTEAHDAGPTEKITFTLGKRASGYLLSAAEFMHRKNYQSSAAQNAIWCITDNYDLFSVFSTDTAMMYNLRRLVANVKGIPLHKVYDDSRTTEPTPVAPRITVSYEGTLRYSLSRSSKVMVALFDEDNHMQTVYVNNEQQREGSYTYRYRVTGEESRNKKLYLRMFRDGVLEHEMAVKPDN